MCAFQTPDSTKPLLLILKCKVICDLSTTEEPERRLTFKIDQIVSCQGSVKGQRSSLIMHGIMDHESDIELDDMSLRENFDIYKLCDSGDISSPFNTSIT